MRRAAELLARLNPTTCRFDVGNGGIPQLTNIDIAGALGMVRGALGRELLVVLYVDQRAPGSMDVVESIMFRRVMEESGERRKACVDAEIRALVAEDEREAMLSRSAHERAKAACFPLSSDVVRNLIRAALVEISKPKHCPSCAGRGSLVADHLVVTCESCSGSGLSAYSMRERARAIGVNESQLRRSDNLRAAYDWCMCVMQDAISTALGDLARALSNARLDS